jgi:gliding motility-associated protein GldC
MPKESLINIKVNLDDEKMPEQLQWQATDSSQPDWQQCKAMMLALWDGAERTALRIDLWTRKMMVDEMNDFFFQTFMTMADTYKRATNQEEIAQNIRKFAHDFRKTADDAMAAAEDQK